MTALPRSSRIDWLLFVALGFMWGSSYLFIKIGVETLPPFTLVMLRLLFGTALLLAVVLVAREPLPRDRRVGHLVVMSVLNVVIPFSLITYGEQSVDSSLASIINAAVPLPTIVLAALFLHDEPITVNRVVGLAVGLSGVLVLTGGGVASGSPSDLPGELALVGSTISYGAGSVYARRNVRGLRPMTSALGQVGFALVITAALAFAFEDPLAVPLTDRALVAVVWLGLLGSGMAYLLFFRLLGRWGSTRTSLVAYLLPVWGIVLGVVVLGERIGAATLLGTALIIGGVALVNARYGTRRLFGRAAPAERGP